MSGVTLVERLRTATGPDRALDAEVARSIGWTEVSARRGGGVVGWAPGTLAPAFVPAFTGSLDAALTLVPEGWCGTVDVGSSPAPHYASLATADAASEGGARTVTETAATSALALCCAALVARGVT